MNRAAIVVPVRLAFETRVLQSTSRALDSDGLFVRCVVPPLPGTKVALRVYLPDGPAEDIEGLVVPERELREVGCRVKFTNLSEAQRARILRLIAPPMLQPVSFNQLPALPPPQPPAPLPPLMPSPAQPSAPPRPGPAPAQASLPPLPPAPLPPPSPAGTLPRSPLARIELRALSRVPVQLKVRFESVDALAERLASDISAGGMFVRAAHPPLVGEEVQLDFSLPGDELPPLSCRALVVRRIAEEEGRLTGRSPGAGVQFIDASDSFRSRLDDWLAQVQGLTELT